MEKAQPPKAAVNTDVDHGGQEGNSPFETDDIWKNALKKFQTENKIDGKEMKDIVQASDLGKAATGVEKATELFKAWRHPPGKETTIMIAVAGCLVWVTETADFVSDHISGTYATPVQIITGSVSKLINAAKDMSEDFDLIEKTFEDIHEAIKNIGLLDKRARNEKEDHFTQRVTDIFIALLDFCYFSAKMFESSRKRRYFRALLKGRNEQIQAKCKNVTRVILMFCATVPVKILSEVERINQKMDDMPDTFRKVIQGLNVSDLPLTQRSSILEKVKRRFGVKPAGMSRLESHMLLIKSNYVEGTFTWLKDNPNYRDWLRAQRTPFLCVSGPSGTGKTYLTYRCYQLLQEMAKPKTLKSETTKTRQNISVAYFFFDPGSETHSLKSALENIIVQIASQDPKYCDSLAKDIDKAGSEKSKDDTAEKLWKTFLSTKFERTAEAFRMTYLLLDGVDLLGSDDLKSLLGLFQGLGCDKTAIQIMMTGNPDKLREMNLKPCEIDLPARTKEYGDIQTIIKHRIKSLNNLKEFSEENRKKIIERLDSQSDGVISFVDLTLTVMDQGGDQDRAMKQIDGSYTSAKLYNSMIEVVLDGRSPSDRISIPTLYAWCTYAKERLSVYELQQVWELDPSLNRDFHVLSEIQGKSKIMLYTTKRLSTEKESGTHEAQPTEDEDPDIQLATGTNVTGTRATVPANDPKLEVIEFRQPSLKTHFDDPTNKMIEDPLKAKVQIFTTLCKVLCDSVASEAESRKSLHRYAASYFVSHLLDIDLIATTALQGRDVVEGLSRVLTNENDVCTIFETVVREKNDYIMSFPLYDDSDAAKRIIAWAKKMSYLEDEELTDTARDWIEVTIKDSGKLFEPLARGHVESLSKKVVAHQAWEPYKLAYHALNRTGRIANSYSDDFFDAWYLGKINVTSAIAITEFAKELSMKISNNKETNESDVASSSYLGGQDIPIDIARIRIALALLLNLNDNRNDRKMAADLYNLNLKPDDDTPGPEKFYSYVGLAEYYASPVTDDETKEAAKTRREDVLNNSDLALKQRLDEKGALGSELDNERCTEAFWLKAHAHYKLDQDRFALKTCEDALAATKELENENSNKKLLNFISLTVTIHAKTDDYFSIISLIRNCQYKMRAEWLWHRWEHVTYKIDSLRKAAVKTGRVDFLVQIYEEAIDYHKDHQNWYGAQILAIDLAVIYRRDARVTKMAENTLDNILKEVKDNLARTWAIDVLRFAIPEIVDILFENYHVARSKASKEAEVMKLNQLVHDLGSTAYIEQMSLAEALLTLAKMLKGIGKIHRAKTQADRAFNLCIEDLGDLVTYNDKSAFRMLGKVLMFIPELQIDAEIALSLQYSEVDRSHEDSQTYAETEAEVAKEEDSTRVERNGVSNATQTAKDETPNKPSDQNGIRPQPAEVSNQNSVEIPQKPGQDGVEPGAAEGSKGNESEDSQQKPGQRDIDEEPSTDSKRKGTGELQQMRTNGEKPKPWTEDLIPEDQRSILCNGPCSSHFDNFQNGANVYYCIDCHDVDFCLECHDKQLRFYTETGEGFWFKCCWAEHQYIKQPVDGWHGVKNGIIRIGAKKKPFKSWLMAVRDKWNAKLAAMGSEN